MNRTGERLRTFPLLALVRRVQVTAALYQALELDPDLGPAHEMLADLYEQSRYFDLTVEHRMEAFRCAAASGPRPAETPDAFRERMRAAEMNLKQAEERLNKVRDQYTVRSANREPLEQAAIALQLGLVQPALEALRRIRLDPAGGADDVAVAQRRALQELEILFRLGRVKEVKEGMTPELAQLLGIHPDLGLPCYDWYRALLAAALGDYVEADEALALAGEEVEKRGVAETLQAVAGLLGQAMLQEVTRSLLGGAAGGQWPGWPNLVQTPGATLLLQAEELAGRVLGREADVEVLRGWLALEQGANRQAEVHLRAALRRPWPPGWTPPPLSVQDSDWPLAVATLTDWAMPPLIVLGADSPLTATTLLAVGQHGARLPVFDFSSRRLAALGLRWLEDNDPDRRPRGRPGPP
jgi:tetratricopeptide (TPR) repeat protein